MAKNTDQRGNITLGSITSWGLGTICLLTGIAVIFDPQTSISAVPTLLIAAFLFPPFRHFVYKKTGKSLSGGVRFVCVLILLGVLGGTMSPSTYSLSNAVIAVGQSGAAISTASTPIASATSAQSGLTVGDFTLEMTEYGGKVIGTAKNNSGKQYSYAQVEFNLYDDAGNQVGSTIANINNLEPNGTWSFEAPVLESRATQAKLKGVTSF